MFPCTKFHLIWRTTKILKKQALNSKDGYSNVRLYQISVNLEKLSFWDQICPKTL